MCLNWFTMCLKYSLLWCVAMYNYVCVWGGGGGGGGGGGAHGKRGKEG